jgi:hypothetical protein
LPWSSDNLLDFIRLQQTRQICAGHDGLRQVVVALQLRLLTPSTVEGVQALESRLGPDAETTNMTTRSKLHEVQFVYRNHRNSGDVTESLGQTLVPAIDDQRTQFAGTATVAHLTLTCAETSGLVNL